MLNNDMPNGLKRALQLKVDVAVKYSGAIKLTKSAMQGYTFPIGSGSPLVLGSEDRGVHWCSDTGFNTHLHVYSPLVVHNYEVQQFISISQN